MLKRAKGYEYEEVKTYIEESDGKKKKKIEKTIKHVPADITAGIFWLRNRKGQVWSNRGVVDVAKIEAETELTKERTKLMGANIDKTEIETKKLEESDGSGTTIVNIVDAWSDSDE